MQGVTQLEPQPDIGTLIPVPRTLAQRHQPVQERDALKAEIGLSPRFPQERLQALREDSRAPIVGTANQRKFERSAWHARDDEG